MMLSLSSQRKPQKDREREKKLPVSGVPVGNQVRARFSGYWISLGDLSYDLPDSVMPFFSSA